MSKEREEAEGENDSIRLSLINKETAQIEKELNRISWKGKSRKDETTSEARNKKRITKSIERAIKSLTDIDVEAYEHLLKSLSPINSYKLCYRPSKKISWHVNK